MLGNVMKLNATSYLAGMGTVVAALTVGFGGALLLTGPSPKFVSQNRLQQVMSQPSTAQVMGVEKSAGNEQTSSSPSQPVTSVNQLPSEPTLPTVTKPADFPTAATPDMLPRASTQDTEKANRARLRQAEVRRAAEREDQRRGVERKKRQQEIETATLAVRRMLQDNRQNIQIANSGPARFGFFGRDD